MRGGRQRGGSVGRAGAGAGKKTWEQVGGQGRAAWVRLLQLANQRCCRLPSLPAPPMTRYPL